MAGYSRRNLKVVLIVLVAMAGKVLSQTNVAAGKAVTGVSTLCMTVFGPCYPPGNLVDGTESVLAWTQHSVNPYFVIDLGKPMQVVTVKIMGDFGTVGGSYNVGVSDTDPAVAPPDPSNYRLCKQYTWRGYALFAEQVTTVDCPTNLQPRRFVVYQEITTTDSLEIGEMQVFVAQKRTTTFALSVGRRVVKAAAMIGSPSKVNHRLDCLLLCVQSEDCDSFNYNALDKSCELHDWDKRVTEAADITADTSWDLWRPTYAVVFL